MGAGGDGAGESKFEKSAKDALEHGYKAYEAGKRGDVVQAFTEEYQSLKSAQPLLKYAGEGIGDRAWEAHVRYQEAVKEGAAHPYLEAAKAFLHVGHSR